MSPQPNSSTAVREKWPPAYKVLAFPGVLAGVPTLDVKKAFAVRGIAAATVLRNPWIVGAVVVSEVRGHHHVLDRRSECIDCGAFLWCSSLGMAELDVNDDGVGRENSHHAAQSLRRLSGTPGPCAGWRTDF